MKLTVNGESHELFVDEETPLLDVLRNDLGLYGAKRGCAQEQCYACCVLVDGRTQPSCQLPVGHVEDLPITTVESLADLRDFFLAEQVGQCGFCISGMMVAAEGLLRQVRYPNDAQIREALDTNVCRCGVYDRVRRAIRFRIGDPEDPICELRTQEPLDPEFPTPPAASPSFRDNPQLDTWIQIDETDTISVRTGKSEIGQGIRTAIAHIAATQLGVDDDRIVALAANTDASPNEGTTSGSLSVQNSGEGMAAAAAHARAIMISKASDELGVPVESLVVANGTITDPATGRETTYWQLHGGVPFKIEVDPTVPRIVDDIRSEGANTRIDLADKMSGVATYVHDFRDETTVHGRVLRPPHYEARLHSLDTSTVEAMPGVVSVVRNGSFVGVVAEREQQAEDAIDALRALADWAGASTIPTEPEDLLAMPLITYDVVDGTNVDYEAPSPSRRDDGSFDLTASYKKQFTMHGSLGPSAAVAHFDGDELKILSPTQGVYPLRESVAEVVKLPLDKVRVEHAEGAGCYGHNGADDVSLDAALLAMAVPDRSILLAWSRADEHRWEPYGPAMIVNVSGDVDEGKIAAFDLENWSYTHSTRPRARNDGSSNLLAAWHLEEPFERPLPQPMQGRHIGAHRNADPLYAIENSRARVHLAQTRSIRTSALRGLGAYTNVFAIESFVDELAHQASIDPVEFRLANLDDPRAIAVIEAVADKAWGTARPADTGRGIGFARYKNASTYFAVIVELTVDRDTGQISINRATTASDSGRIVSPDGVSNQLEGGCVQAASWTLKEAVQLKPDQVTSIDWETYPVLRFGESFPIDTILLDRPDQTPLGCGEAAQGPMGAAIANAVFDAVGARIRELPLTPERVKAALNNLPHN